MHEDSTKSKESNQCLQVTRTLPAVANLEADHADAISMECNALNVDQTALRPTNAYE